MSEYNKYRDKLYNIAIFASGNGSNAENIAKYFSTSDLAHVSVVMVNRQSAGVIERMQPLGIETIYVPNDIWDNNAERVVEMLKERDIDLIALAGFMHYVSPVILKAFNDRVLNIHPSLLPAYGGKGMWGHHVHEAVIAGGETESGATVHKVSDVMDGGEIILAHKVAVLTNDTPADLEARVHEAEYIVYPQAIEKVLSELS